MPDEAIDTTDVPEVSGWSGAVRRGLYRPRKEAITIRLDADVLAWFRSHTQDGKGYQSEINRVLRKHVAETEKQRA
ncbi:MAG TPA: BrnA antitoxin family protein [Rhodopila sp.]|nr:BrnA antitoxin family protein [Rhodopila sp.]